MNRPITPTAITAVRDAKAAQAAAEVATLVSVVAWAAEFRVEDAEVTEESFGENGVLLGGAGCPLVSEFHVYDLAAGLGMSSESGCHFVGRTLELRYRLRRTWEQVVALEVPVWKAFKVCDATMNLSWEAAVFIDRMLAPVLHSCTFAQIERTVNQAIDLHDPEEAERRRAKDAEDRGFEVHLGGPTRPAGSTVDVTGSLALEDALDLEQAVKNGAKTLGDLGCEESLGARRAMAVGEMARKQLALDLTNDGDKDDDDLEAGTTTPTSTTPGSTGGRGVTLYAHLDADGMHGFLDNVGGGDVLIEQIRSWCQAVGNTVTIRPVIDLNTQISTNAYTPTDKLIDQVRLRDQTCVFPNCAKRGRYCDLDHRVPYDQDNPAAGGETSTENVALLCRRHHRAKTFSAWRYDSPEPGVYTWRSPSGQRFIVVRGRRYGNLPVTTLIDAFTEP